MYLKKILITTNVLCICIILEVNSEKKIYNIKKASKLFSDFVWKFDKKYCDKAEYKLRLKIFTQNLKDINKRNKKSDGVEFSITTFSDMTEDELKIFKIDLKKDNATDKRFSCKRAPVKHTKLMGIVPDEFDWRYYNIVTPVLWQGNCASCWAITAVAAIETLHAIKYNRLIRLSVQQLVDCTEGWNSCGGGLPCHGLNKAATGDGIAAEHDYPYMAVKGNCRINELQKVIKVSTALRHYFEDENELKALVYNKGPVIVGITTGSPFFNYRTGIGTPGWFGCSPTDDITHAVLIVGYGTAKGIPYWIIKNSYGAGWGEYGYFRLLRGVKACNILAYVVEAVIQ